MGGKKREKEGFMYVIKDVSISRFSFLTSVNISRIFVAPKKYTIQLHFTEILNFCMFWLNLYYVSELFSKM